MIEMKIRPFQETDDRFCFRLRSRAFVEKFNDELTPQQVSAAVDFYLPEDYIRLARETMLFIVEQNDGPVGFFNLKRKTSHTAELPLIYLDLDHLGEGIGSACIDYIGKWLAENWPEVNELIVDTVIPKYNAGFYEKVGFIPIESTTVEFAEQRIKALRLVRKLSE